MASMKTGAFLSDKAKSSLYDNILQNRLYQAVFTRNIPQVVKYLNKGVSPNHIYQESGWAPLHVLAVRNDTVLGYRLMQCPDIDLNIKNTHGHTPLHVACTSKCKRFVQILVQMGADVNISDRFGKTPLHYAVKSECFSIIHYLLTNKADVNAMDCLENTPLSTSLLDVPNMLIAKRLCKESIDLSIENKKSTLHVFFECVLACQTIKEIEHVLLLLDIGVDVNLRDKWSRRNCLHFVGISGYLELAVVLVQRGADLTTVDCLSRTPATVAKEYGNAVVADYFRKGYRPGNVISLLPMLKMWLKKYRQKQEERRLEEEAE